MKIRVIPILFFLLGLGARLTSCSVSKVQLQNDSAIANTEADTRAREDDSLVIWWQQTYVSGADEVSSRLVREWEKNSGIKTTTRIRRDRYYEFLFDTQIQFPQRRSSKRYLQQL